MVQDRTLIGAPVQFSTASGWWYQNMLESGAVLTAVLSKKPPPFWRGDFRMSNQIVASERGMGGSMGFLRWSMEFAAEFHWFSFFLFPFLQGLLAADPGWMTVWVSPCRHYSLYQYSVYVTPYFELHNCEPVPPGLTKGSMDSVFLQRTG